MFTWNYQILFFYINEKLFTRVTNCISKAGADDTHFTRVVNQMSNASSPCSINDSFIINPKHISASTLHEENVLNNFLELLFFFFFVISYASNATITKTNKCIQKYSYFYLMNKNKSQVETQAHQQNKQGEINLTVGFKDI
jgi:hypothetical protein